MQSLEPSIAGRYTEGSLGVGGTTHWDISASTDAQGDGVIRNGGTLTFYPKQADGSFQAPAGNRTTLFFGSGAYQLDEAGGGLYQFNPDGTLAYMQDANGNRVTAGYNNVGQLISLTDSNGASFTLTYTAAGRLAQLTDSNGLVETYGYDPTGNFLTTYTDNYGTTTYSYVTGASAAQNNALWPKSLTRTIPTPFSASYDSQGRLIDEHRDGGAEDVSISYLNPAGFTESDVQGGQATTYFNLYGIPAETTSMRLPAAMSRCSITTPISTLVQAVEPGSGVTYSPTPTTPTATSPAKPIRSATPPSSPTTPPTA